jgi:hypothetical protein
MSMDENKVLAFSPDKTAMRKREAALRNGGFEVFSANTESEARFEIEMGRCGIFLICFRTPPQQTKELTDLFRKYCRSGRVIFVMHDARDTFAADADLLVRESNGPDAIVQALRSDLQSKMA